jgi:hypothetical protein
MITTQSTHTSYNQASFHLPAYSKILNIFYDNDQFTILYEYDSNETESKTFVIEFWNERSSNSAIYEPSFGFNYWGSITKTNPTLDSQSSGAGMSTNISFNLITFTSNFHIFVKEILSTAEMRDKKIEEII